jgi:hypothetical protein
LTVVTAHLATALWATLNRKRSACHIGTCTAALSRVYFTCMVVVTVWVTRGSCDAIARVLRSIHTTLQHAKHKYSTGHETHHHWHPVYISALKLGVSTRWLAPNCWLETTITGSLRQIWHNFS